MNARKEEKREMYFWPEISDFSIFLSILLSEHFFRSDSHLAIAIL
jgi:hypothetical protein